MLLSKKKKKKTLNLLLSHVWWRIARFSGATIALFCLPNASREKAFKVSALMMGANLLLFSFGYGISAYGLSFYSLSCYNLLEPNGSPLQIILGVVKLAIHNRHCNCPCTKKGVLLEKPYTKSVWGEPWSNTFVAKSFISRVKYLTHSPSFRKVI